MKIKQIHFDHLKKEIDQVLADHPNMIGDYERGQFNRSSSVGDLQKRLCFDLLFATGLTSWVSDNLYSYMTDDHIYTTLKKIVPTVTRKY